MNATTKTLGLAFALALTAFGAACGPPPSPETPSGAASASPEAGSALNAGPSSGAARGAASASPSPAAPPAATAKGPSVSTPLGASKYIEDVKKLGIDFKKATELDKISLSEKKKLMPLFQKSMGYDACTDCHVASDFKKVTHNMQIARGMWKSFVAPLRDEKGNPIFCDSCHQGKAEILNRADKKGVEKFMLDNYVARLTSADKKDVECATCHGDPPEYKIIEKVWKIPPT